MNIKKKEIVYFCFLIFSIFIIYNTFHMAFADVMFIKARKEINIFLLPFNNYLYLFTGLILTGFTIYLYMNLNPYQVEKLFVGYITIVSMEICLIAVTNCKYEKSNILIGALAFFSNIILFSLIGHLTQVFQIFYFKWMMKIYHLMALCIGVYYLIYVIFSNHIINQKYHEIIIWDYIITIFMIILVLLFGYRKSTIYSKKQIKFLLIGLILGVIVFIIAQLSPLVAVIKYTDRDVGVYESYYPVIQMENLGNQYPIMIFSGVIIAIIYILIKREYLIFDNIKELWCYIISVVYLVLTNTYFYFILSDDRADFISINFILTIPLFLYIHQVCKEGNDLYDNNMIGILEEERQKLSMFLHDEVLQSLIALSHMEKDKDINEKLASVIGEIRDISHELYPMVVEDLGVEEALQIFVNDINNDYNVEVKYSYEYPKGILPRDLSLVIYRTVRELVINAIKHSSCIKIEIKILEYSEGIQCIVTDDGKGFPKLESDKLLKNQHMGLYTIRKQIVNLNGNMRLITDKTGSKFMIYIPLR